MSPAGSDQRVNGLLQILVRSVAAIRDAVRNLLIPGRFVIDGFVPMGGFAGTLIEITGSNFGPGRDDNHVKVGGQDAVVIEASTNRLKALVGLKATTGPVEVTVLGRTRTGPRDFQIQPFPYAGSPDDGPPILSVGAGKGEAGHAPVTGNVRLLIVPCYPADRKPAQMATAHAAVNDLFTQADTYYRQVSYDALTFNMTVAGWHQLSGKYTDYVPAGTDNIDNPAGLERLMAEAAKAAEDAGHDLDNFDIMGCALFTNGGFIRGWGGWPQNNFQYGTTINVAVGHPVYLFAVGETADWGRCAHEIGHCLVEGNIVQTGIKPEDVYQDLPTDLQVVATADAFDLMGGHDTHPLFSAFYMQQLGYYSNANIVELTWDRNAFPAAGQPPVEYQIVAHGTAQNTSPNRFHLVRIKVADGLYYYIEVRQRPDPASVGMQVFDEQIPLDGAGANQGGVVVTKAFTGLINMNQTIRFITLMHDVRVLRQGDVVTDPLRDIKISVVADNVSARPLVSRVRVEWAQQIAADPNGKFDLHVKSWDSSYQSDDIWVDCQPWGIYEHADSAGKPVGNGDRPRVNRINHFWGRVSNEGADPATNVRLTFYAVEPPGVGDNGNWGPLGTKVFANIGAKGSGEDYVSWTPTIGQHTCLKVVAEAQLGEVSVSNNWAQENVFEFDALGSSVPDPVTIPFAVRNPLKERTAALISVSGLPEGFIAQVPHAWVWLDALEERRMNLTVVPQFDIAIYERKQINTANVKVDGRIPHVYRNKIPPGDYPPSRLRPIGGLLAQISPKHRAEVQLWEDREIHGPERVGVQGHVTPAIAGQPVMVELTDPKARLRVEQVITDFSGRFHAVFDLTHAPTDDTPGAVEHPIPGSYMSQAFIVNAAKLAEAESNVVYVTK